MPKFDDVETIETKHGGFYVNLGHVDGDDGLSDDEPLVAAPVRKSPGYVFFSTGSVLPSPHAVYVPVNFVYKHVVFFLSQQLRVCHECDLQFGYFCGVAECTYGWSFDSAAVSQPSMLNDDSRTTADLLLRKLHMNSVVPFDTIYYISCCKNAFPIRIQ